MRCFLKCFGTTILTTSPRKRKQRPPLESQGLRDGVVVREFSWEEIERSTASFSRSRVIGCGGFSTVYLADIDVVDRDTAAAVKIVYGSRVFQEELEILRQLHHRNIVELIGYSRDNRDDQVGALVLEYVSNGTLEEKLRRPSHDDGGILIPWSKRMAIAYQVAEALEYLHDKCGSLPVVHGDIKASNVLLDRHLNSRLCDFGSANMGFSAAVQLNKRTVMTGSPGYTDPHYLRTGVPSKKNDVYSFGVLLLHLLTGAQPFCPRTGQLLTSLLRPVHNVAAHTDDDASDVARDLATSLVDPRLAGHFDCEEAAALLCLSARCLRQPPTLRPCASQILHTISSNCNTTPISSLSEFLISSKQ